MTKATVRYGSKRQVDHRSSKRSTQVLRKLSKGKGFGSARSGRGFRSSLTRETRPIAPESSNWDKRVPVRDQGFDAVRSVAETSTISRSAPRVTQFACEIAGLRDLDVK